MPARSRAEAVALPEEIVRIAKRAARALGISRSHLYRIAIIDYLRQLGYLEAKRLEVQKEGGQGHEQEGG